MWVTPRAFVTDAGQLVFDTQMDPVPLPPWSGVPVTMPMEIGRETLRLFLAQPERGMLVAIDGEGRAVRCAAEIDREGSHTCETDTVLMLIQQGPFEPDGEER